MPENGCKGIFLPEQDLKKNVNFGANSRTMDKNKTVAIITGATSGIGRETAIALAGEGIHLVLPVRSMEKGKILKEEIKEKTGNGQVDVMEADLGSFRSIRAFAEQFNKKYDRLHLLINNAGIWEVKRKLSEDGVELTFAVNHLAPFLLTNLLLDTIKASAPARIINVASTVHKQAFMKLHDVEMKKGWGSLRAYAQSKLANVLFTRKLAADLKGTGVTVNCLHPGVVASHLFDRMPSFIRNIAAPFMITPKNGAQTTVYLATSPEVRNVSGEYFARKNIASTSRRSKNMEVAERLWELSKTYCGL